MVQRRDASVHHAGMDRGASTSSALSGHAAFVSPGLPGDLREESVDGVLVQRSEPHLGDHPVAEVEHNRVRHVHRLAAASSGGTSIGENRSEQPQPLRSDTMSRPKVGVHYARAVRHGFDPSTVRLDEVDPTSPASDNVLRNYT